MIRPAELEQLLEATRRDLHAHGALTWSRFADWVKERRIITDSTRGGGVGAGLTDRRIEEHRLDAQASGYQRELAALTSRLHTDLTRLQRLIEIANPAAPRPSTDAGCRSCARDQGRYEPSAPPRYSTACRFCGDWRGEHGDWPPLAVVRWRAKHPGKKVPVSVVGESLTHRTTSV